MLVSLCLPLALWKSRRALVRGLPCSGGKVKPLHKGDEQVMRHQKPVTSCPFCKWLSLLKGLLYFCPYLFCDDTVCELMVCFLHGLFIMHALLQGIAGMFGSPHVLLITGGILGDCIMKICSTSVWYDLIYCRPTVNTRPP